MNSARRSRTLASHLAAISVASMMVAAPPGIAAPPGRAPLAYWAFNCFATCGDANFNPETVSLSPASMTSNFEPDAGSNESGTTLNAVPPYEARAALTLRTGTGGMNNGRTLTWRVATTGYAGVRVSFATSRSPAGFSINQFQYTLDGTNYVNFGQPFDPGGEYAVVSYDLRHVRDLNDNPNAGFRIVFSGGSTSSASEFALIDNLQVVGK